MHQLFNFHFLDTISKQLHEALEGLALTPLNAETLVALQAYQSANSAQQGVYLLHYDNQPVYLGKADDVAERLGQHLTKLLGRQYIDPPKIGYKCILLDKSMSTAANEKVLITLFEKSHKGMWNGKGFGPKDPGQERDTTKPSEFDKNHPIRLDIPIANITESETVGSLCQKIKDQLPWVFRYELDETVANNGEKKKGGRSKTKAAISGRGPEKIDVSGVEPYPKPLLQALLNHLGNGWRGAIISFGMVLYYTDKKYPYGETLLPTSNPADGLSPDTPGRE